MMQKCLKTTSLYVAWEHKTVLLLSARDVSTMAALAVIVSLSIVSMKMPILPRHQNVHILTVLSLQLRHPQH